MSLKMKLPFKLLKMIVIILVAVGCYTVQPPVNQELLAGNYTFVSNDPESRVADHNLNHLVLQSDGTYDLVEGGTTKAVSEKKGAWRIVRGRHPTVLLDQAGYPIKIEKNEVRLLVDTDVGIWWVKAK